MGEYNDEGDYRDGMRDRYLDLFVGPCEANTAEAEAECEFVEIIYAHKDDFDCSYDEWVAMFRAETRLAAEAAPRNELDPERLLTPQMVAEAEIAQETGFPIKIDDRHRVERVGPHWVVTEGDSTLFDLEDFGWLTGGVAALRDSINSARGVDDVPRFTTAKAALAAYFHSVAAHKAQQARYSAAMKRLGRDDPEGESDSDDPNAPQGGAGSARAAGQPKVGTISGRADGKPIKYQW